MKTGFWLRGGKGEATALQKISFFSFLVLRAFAEKGVYAWIIDVITFCYLNLGQAISTCKYKRVNDLKVAAL